MTKFRAEVLEVEGKPVKKKKGRGLFSRRGRTKTNSTTTEIEIPQETSEAPTITESPWVSRAQAGGLPVSEYYNSRIATGTKKQQEAKRVKTQRKKRRALRARLGLDQSNS